MVLIAGVDIGNSSTEVALTQRTDDERWEFVASDLFRTTGLKGTKENVPGVINALRRATEQVGRTPDEIDRILLNEAAPVIGDVAMETITETVITESTMIGHDPSTPGGHGIGTGVIVEITDDMADHSTEDAVVFVIDATVDFAVAAQRINEWTEAGYEVSGAIVEKDDAVLIDNRINIEIPIVDEVSKLEAIPRGQPSAVEVASPETGKTMNTLSNPYGIATVFELSAEETRKIIPVARALVGNKSAVVVKTPTGDVEERTIPAGTITVVSERGTTTIDIDQGADTIMDAVMESWPITDVRGESGTNIGGMLNRAREQMAEITEQDPSSIEIRDIMAVDTLVPQKVEGAVANEYRMENSVGLAAMVKTKQLPMRQIADGIESEIGTDVLIQGIEANMAALGSLTTPGTDLPIAILDMGGGSTDAAYMNQEKVIDSIHLSGAGDMVTMLIDSELGLDDWDLAEAIKKYPAAKVETLFSFRHEDGTVNFLDEAVEPELFGRTVLLEERGNMRPLSVDTSVEEIRRIRRQAKQQVFVENAERALRLVTPASNIRHLPFVVMVGRSSLDFEIPELISDTLAEYGIVCGRGNVRGEMGPRNAVATGLILSHVDGGSYLDFELPTELATSLERPTTTTGDDA